MPSAAYDLQYLEAGLAVIEQYLLSPEVYWPIGINAPRGEMAYPQLTLGGMLLAVQRLHASARQPSQQSSLRNASIELDAARQRWPVAWGRKASTEFPLRLNLWRDFLEDYRRKPSTNADRYAYEVSRRVQLQLLQPEADMLQGSYTTLLTSLDRLLKVSLIQGNFIWDPILSPVFPVGTYWYLYGRLKN